MAGGLDPAQGFSPAIIGAGNSAECHLAFKANS
jgi:hypothetical protein